MGVAIVQKDERWAGRSTAALAAEVLGMGSMEVGENIVHIDWRWYESVQYIYSVGLRTRPVHGDAEKVDIYRARNQKCEATPFN